MFKGNPRDPGTLSFETLRFVLDGKRMSRLRNASWNPKQPTARQPSHDANSPRKQPTDEDAMEGWNDEWIVAHLCSDAMTGLRHEIDVLTSLGILSVAANGDVILKEGWERRVPHILLNEMEEAWGSGADGRDLFCLHERIRSSLENQWEHGEDGWRLASTALKEDEDGAIGADELVLDDEEYRMREEIFKQNHFDWVSETSGMGEFGV